MKKCWNCKYVFTREGVSEVVCVEEYMHGKPGTKYGISKPLPKERVCDKWEQKK